MVDFIGVYDKVTSPKMCKKIINFFEDNKDLHIRGRYSLNGQIVRDPSVKDSMDLYMEFNVDAIPNIIIAKVLNAYTSLYIDTFTSTEIVDEFSVDM